MIDDVPVSLLDALDDDPARFLPVVVGALTAYDNDEWDELRAMVEENGGYAGMLLIVLAMLSGFMTNIAEAAGMSRECLLQGLARYQP